MKNKLPLILTLIFAIGSIIVAYQLYSKVIEEKELQEEIITEEEAIKQKLLFYSEIQKLTSMFRIAGTTFFSFNYYIFHLLLLFVWF